MKKVNRLYEKFYSREIHPYRVYENKIKKILKENSVLLDAGCGRTAPVLSKFIDDCSRLIGVDLEDSSCSYDKIKYLKSSIEQINLPDSSVDIVISRAVFEHIKNPYEVFNEINRILRKNGDLIFLVPNLYDYVSLASLIIPNKYHKSIVSKTEGRDVADVFPAYYKVNTLRQIKRIALKTNFTIVSFERLSQYPSNFMFNPYLFLLATLLERLINKVKVFDCFKGWLLVHIKKVN